MKHLTTVASITDDINDTIGDSAQIKRGWRWWDPSLTF